MGVRRRGDVRRAVLVEIPHRLRQEQLSAALELQKGGRGGDGDGIPKRSVASSRKHLRQRVHDIQDPVAIEVRD